MVVLVSTSRHHLVVKRLVAAMSLALVAAIGACGDDDDQRVDPITAKSEYADMTIYFQQAVYNDVTYTCLLSGYSNAPAMWCERTPEEELYP